MADPQASLLTNTHRAMLTDRRTPAHEDRVRRRMKERVYNGLRIDGPLLFEQLSSKDRRDIFRRWEKDLHDNQLEDFSGEILQPEMVLYGLSPEQPDEMEELERRYLQTGITNLLSFLYLGIEEGNIGDFGNILESALSKAAWRTDRSLSEFDLTVEMTGVRQRRPQTIAEMVREGDDGDLTLNEVLFAIEEGALDPADAEEILQNFERFFDWMDRVAEKYGRNDEE